MPSLFKKERDLTERSRSRLKNKECRRLSEQLLAAFPALAAERLEAGAGEACGRACPGRQQGLGAQRGAGGEAGGEEFASGGHAGSGSRGRGAAVATAAPATDNSCGRLRDDGGTGARA